MTDGPHNPLPGVPVSLVDRAKNIILSPKTEWDRIDAEPSTISSIFTSYVMILAAIGPVAGLIGQQVFGIGAFGYSWKPSIGYSIGNAVLSYILALVLVYVLGLIIDALAPTFGGTKNPVKAFKVAAYSSTPGWIAGIFAIIPMLAWLALVGGLYGLYVMYLGLPKLMRVTEDKAIGYIIATIVAWIVLFFIVSIIIGMLVATFFGVAAVTTPTVRY